MRQSTVLNKESEFGFDELFFSRTNERGIIEAGNSVFQRVSQYDWAEMLGKPHKLIRHPHMPRGVFHLFWETIQANQMIGAYVINRAKDGSYYWVYALASPIEGGYLSVRLKPSSSIFDQVQLAYAELLKQEKGNNLSPNESQQALLKMIKSLGFANYWDFMVEALMQELESRQTHLQMPPLPILSLLRTTLESGASLQKRSEEISNAYQESALVPLNLEVQAARIGQEAAPIATISSQYDSLARDIQTEIGNFVRAGQVVQNRIQSCQFNICNSILHKEIYRFFELETEETPVNKQKEMAALALQEHAQLECTKTCLKEIQKEFLQFQQVYDDVEKLAIGLEIVSLSGKIEAAKLKNYPKELFGLLNDLTKFKNSLRKSLQEISTISSLLIEQTELMRKALVAS